MFCIWLFGHSIPRRLRRGALFNNLQPTVELGRAGKSAPTVIVSGGANVRSWIKTPCVQAFLKLVKQIFVAFDRESSFEKQEKTSAAHQKKIEQLREVFTARVNYLMPPEDYKDLAE